MMDPLAEGALKTEQASPRKKIIQESMVFEEEDILEMKCEPESDEEIVETPSAPKRKKECISAKLPDCDGSTSFTPATPIRPSTSCPPKKQRNYNLLNYGSEDELGEGDEDDDDAFSSYPLSVRVLPDTAVHQALDEYIEEEVPVPIEEVVLEWAEQSTSFMDEDTSSLVHQPTDMYDFIWRAFPNPQIPPNLRREVFKSSNLGPRDHYTDPYMAFTAIWDKGIMKHICAQTNLYVQQTADIMMSSGRLGPNSRINSWKDLDEDELYVYLAIVLATGVTVKSRLEEYWTMKNDIFSSPGFAAVMPLRRFQLITQYLHFNDNSRLDNTVSSSQAKLYKIEPIISHLNRKFSELYSLSQNIAFDESLTQWKGKLGINQFIPNKVAVVGIKTYEICESRTGYLWRFEVHSSSEHQQDSDPVSGTIPSIVLRLLHDLEYKGHTVWMDNYYNSPALARRLKSINFDCVGTLRTNRQFVPLELANLQKSTLAQGQITGCTSGDVDLLVWRDRNLVGLISTFHGATTTKCGETLKPTLVHDYNVCMGGVDKKDQMLAQYPIERKRTRVWYKKFFRRLLNVSVLNAFILFRHNNPTVTHRNFRLNLTRDLLTRHQNSPTVSTALTTQKRVKFTAEMLNHLPAEMGSLSGKNKLRRICVVCKKLTQTNCPGCNVALCIFRRNLSSNSDRSNTISCFASYHS